jgi:hypothetical protein
VVFVDLAAAAADGLVDHEMPDVLPTVVAAVLGLYRLLRRLPVVVERRSVRITELNRDVPTFYSVLR